MRALALVLLVLRPLLAAAGDTATVRIIPETLNPGQPFRMEIAIASSDDFPGPALRIGSELPVIDDIPLRFAGQRMSSGNLTTLLVSGVAPIAPGEYTIPAFTATLAIRKIEVPATRLRVRPGDPATTAGFAKFSIQLPDRALYVGETIAAEVSLEHGSGERVMGAYGIEARGEGLACRPKGPILTQPNGGLRAELEVTPTQPGTLDLRVTGTAQVDSPGTGSGERPFVFTRKLRVIHVPERDRPADWTGAVGSLAAGPATLSNPRPGIGEPTVLSITVTGEANLERMLPPEVPHGDAWDVLPIETSGRQARSAGQRTFAYTLVPRLPGKLATPPVRLSFFNPRKRAYERIEFPPIQVTVTGQAPAKVELVAIDPSAPAETGQVPAARATELAAPVGGGRVAGGPPLLADPATLGWTQLGGLLAVATALSWAARRDWLARHPELVRRREARRALRAARRRLRRAERAGDADRHAAAAVEALRAGAAPLLVAATDRALTAEDILRAAPELAAPTAVREVFLRADGTRFGGSPAQATLARHGEIERCLGQLEAHLCD